MRSKIISKYLRILPLIILALLISSGIQNSSAQTPKRIKFTPCRSILPITGNLTKKKNSFLYAIQLTKGQVLKLNLSSTPNYKETRVNVYYESGNSDSKFPILQGEVSTDYDVPIEETGEYSIMIFTYRRTAKFSLSIDVEDKRWKC